MVRKLFLQSLLLLYKTIVYPTTHIDTFTSFHLKEIRNKEMQLLPTVAQVVLIYLSLVLLCLSVLLSHEWNTCENQDQTEVDFGESFSETRGKKKSLI